MMSRAGHYISGQLHLAEYVLMSRAGHCSSGQLPVAEYACPGQGTIVLDYSP
jgi:hypothetical protein